MSTAVATIDTTRSGIPLSRILKVELRKMFNTRSGFWLMLSIAIVALITTVSVIAFAPDDIMTYNSFVAAIGVPFALLLPIVAYVVYSYVLPVVLGILAATQQWFKDLQPWVDFNQAQAPLFDGMPSGEEWAQIATSGTIWFIIPMIVGVWLVLRAEVK